MSIIEKLEKFKIDNNKYEVESNYLNNKAFTTVLNLALVDLYKKQPNNPISYLAHFLLNESRSQLIQTDIQEIELIQKEFKNKAIVKKQKESEEEAIQKQLEQKAISQKNKLFEVIQNSDDIERDLGKICNSLKELTNSTGVYFSLYEQKRRFISIEEDENAHLLPDNEIRYIAFDDNSKFLENKCLEQGEGVTYNLFASNEENQDNVKVDDEDNNFDKKESTEPKNIYIEEVIRNPNIKFYLEPKLGCYLALDLTFLSSLSNKSLESSILKLNEYNQEIAEIEQRRLLKEAELKELEEKRKEGDDQDARQIINEEVKEEVAILKEFDKDEKKLILSLDTLGQDREYTQDEKEYIFKIGKFIQTSWYELEHKLLLKDRDMRIDLKEKELSYLQENKEDKMKEGEDKYYKEYLFQKYEDK